MPATLSVFPFVPAHPYQRRLIDPTAIATFSGSPLTARATLLSRAYHAFAWQARLSAANLATLEAFWIARRGPAGLLYYKDPVAYIRTAVSLGTSIAAQTVFALPVGAYLGDFPISNASAILYSDGSPITIASIDTDGRTITASSAPGAGHAMTATYHYYRKVRFVSESFEASTPAVGTYEVPVDLVEEVG